VPDPILIILFIVFFVLPLLEKAMKRGQGPPPPPAQRPQRPPTQEEEWHELHDHEELPPARRGAPTATDDDDGPAAEMIPDDLWEILTGERRGGPPEPQRERAPEPEEHASYRRPEEDHWQTGVEREAARAAERDREEERLYETDVAGDAIEDAIEDEIAASERLRHDRERHVHTAERAPRREAELVVYEPGEVQPRRRGSIVAAAPLVPKRGGRAGMRDATVHPKPAAPESERVVHLGVLGAAGRRELRRAFILKEILDRPKGLE
jgi:hypothetical protein